MSKFITRHAGAAKSAAVTLIAASVIGVSFEMWSRPLINRFGVPSVIVLSLDALSAAAPVLLAASGVLLGLLWAKAPPRASAADR